MGVSEMSWAAWFLIAWFGFSTWLLTGVVINHFANRSAGKAALYALLFMWLIPPIFVRELIKGLHNG